MRLFRNLLVFLVIGIFFSGTVCAVEDGNTYVDEEQGRGTWHSMFGAKQSASAQQWEHALNARNKGRLKRADRRMLYLVRRWPNSKEAPLAQRARADMLYSRGKLKDAFREYQYLIDNYSSRMHDYDAVLENQFNIAVDIMNHKRMRWLFGGYRAPEYAVEYFEDVIRNGPQWEHAPDVQFLIGKAYQESGQLELAVTAYAVIGYHYPDSALSEDAAWRQILCLDKLRKEFPHSSDCLTRTLTATTVFLSTYPESKHKSAIVQLRNRLYEVKARKAFEEAEFYVKVAKESKAAILYYEAMIKEYPKSKLVPEAKKRIAELEALINASARSSAASAQPTLRQPAPEKGSDHARK